MPFFVLLKLYPPRLFHTKIAAKTTNSKNPMTDNFLILSPLTELRQVASLAPALSESDYNLIKRALAPKLPTQNGGANHRVFTLKGRGLDCDA